MAGSFEVKKYEAIGTATEVGPNLLLEYTPGAGDPTPGNSRLNWIQRVVSNHSNKGHGSYEDVIEHGITGPGISYPFYFSSVLPLAPPTFNYSYETDFTGFSREYDSGMNHDWLAELYLVNQTGLQTATIYNGIQWGWENRVQPVPEPLTIFSAGVCLGFGALFKKTVKGTGQNKTKSLEKLKK